MREDIRESAYLEGHIWTDSNVVGLSESHRLGQRTDRRFPIRQPGLIAVSVSELLKKLNELVATASTVQQNGEPTTDAVTLSPTKQAEGATTPNPVSSTFGFYTGGLRGVTFTIGATTLF